MKDCLTYQELRNVIDNGLDPDTPVIIMIGDKRYKATDAHSWRTSKLICISGEEYDKEWDV
jgi:hypothetical protein